MNHSHHLSQLRIRLADGIDYQIPYPDEIPAEAADFYPALSAGSVDERREAVRELRRAAGWEYRDI